jgi:hypothetical protein
MREEYITGLSDADFIELVGRVREVLESRSSNMGRPELNLIVEQCEMTLMMLRHNMTQEMVGGLYGVSQPTVSRVKDRIEPIIDEVLAFSEIGLEEAGKGRVVVVDGTYVPTGNRSQTGRTNYSGKRHCQCVNIQVACDLEGGLLAVSEPVAGAHHDYWALEETGWKDILESMDWIADTAYISTNATTPKKKPQNCDMPDSYRSFNHQLSGFRYVVERCNAHLKNWKILKTGYRRQLKKLAGLIRVIVRLELYRLGW